MLIHMHPLMLKRFYLGQPVLPEYFVYSKMRMCIRLNYYMCVYVYIYKTRDCFKLGLYWDYPKVGPY